TPAPAAGRPHRRARRPALHPPPRTPDRRRLRNTGRTAGRQGRRRPNPQPYPGGPMPIAKRIEGSAADQKAGMTLDELAAIVQEAMRAGLPGDTRLRAWVNMRGGIKRLETVGAAV